MAKIKMASPVIELAGDEIARVTGSLIGSTLILPHLVIDRK